MANVILSYTRYSPTLFLCVLVSLLICRNAQSQELLPAGPIAYVGHGAMFDENGNEVAPSTEFIGNAQRFYHQQLWERADDDQKQRYAEVQRRLTTGGELDKQSQLVVESRLLEWLIRQVPTFQSDELLRKSNVMKLLLNSRLSQESIQGQAPGTQPFSIPEDLQQRIDDEGLSALELPENVARSVTSAGGQAYRDLCRNNGVPIPPNWGTAGWISRGTLNPDPDGAGPLNGDVFIIAGSEAEVFTFQSSSPEGMCIALPRSAPGSNTIPTLGIICQGKQSSKACFWDNQSNGSTFSLQKGEVRPFADFAGGADLVGNVGGVCTECHTGENAYNIHPGTALGRPALDGLPLFPDNWHEPIVQSGWPQNPGPATAPSACAGCHSAGGSGGRLPAVSTELRGYCNSVLEKAVERTMPLGAPGSLQSDPGVRAFQAMCNEPPRPNEDFLRWAGTVWSHTGTACSGQSCPGWKKLDNNLRTVALVAGNDKLYQLHNDGLIWESTGAACNGASCPGWRKIDNNPRTVALAEGGNALYQLHNTGAVWKYTGTACSGDQCPGWQRLDNNPRTIAIAASGNKIYQLHIDGRIWISTGGACSGESCPGWRLLDNNPRSIAIRATGDKLFQMHVDGRIWEHTGAACSDQSCPGWRLVDNNPRTTDISANGNSLYQRHHNGQIWEYTGSPCNGNSCPGWRRLDNNPRSTSINGGVYQDHQDGRIWKATGTACSGDSCPGWRMLDNNPRSQFSLAADQSNDKLYQLHASKLFQLHDNGSIWQSMGDTCSGNQCPSWQKLDNNSRTKAITASAGKLFQLHDNGRVWQSTGQPCSGDSCPGWRLLDNNLHTKFITSAGGRLYQLHDNGSIWRSTGQACNGDSCHGWVKLDNNARTVEIAAGAGQLYQRHSDGRIWRFTGQPCSGNNCGGWTLLDNNTRTQKIVASGGKLYQLHQGGRIWRHTGQPCSNDSCPGWTLMDNNSRTQEIVAGGRELYQRHSDGRIWESTGSPCDGDSCRGWRMLDNNSRTIQLTAAGGNVYQRHNSGAIWRSDGRECVDDRCPGWQQLDNNTHTVAIEAAHE